MENSTKDRDTRTGTEVLAQARDRFGDGPFVSTARAVEALAKLPDQELAQLVETLNTLEHDHLSTPAVWSALVSLVAPAWMEERRRTDDVENARIQLEAGGHEAFINFDRVMHERDGRGWTISCHCEAAEHAEGRMATYAEALTFGNEHLDATGGSWAQGAPWPEEACLDPWGYWGRP